MPKLNQQGVIAHFLLFLLLATGLIVGLYLVKNQTNIFPKAGGSQPIGPETSFTLIGPSQCALGWACVLELILPPSKGEEFNVRLYVRSDIEAANLFTAKMVFPKGLVEVKEIKTDNSFIKNWVENFYDNNAGEISLVGGVPSPGYQTQVGRESVLMATIVFRAKALGRGTVSFADASTILSNLNNINILTIKRGYDLSVEVKPLPTPISAPLPSPTPPCVPRPVCKGVKPPCELNEPDSGWCPAPSPTPPPGPKGDGNKDGKINLVDMSILHTDWMKTKDKASYHPGVDMNSDGIINSFDFALHKALLLQLGVIRKR